MTAIPKNSYIKIKQKTNQ